VRSVKEEALSRMILLGERALWHVLNQYLSHYHEERPHQGKGNVMLFPSAHTDQQPEGPYDAENGSVGCSSTITARPHEFFGHSSVRVHQGRKVTTPIYFFGGRKVQPMPEPQEPPWPAPRLALTSDFRVQHCSIVLSSSGERRHQPIALMVCAP